MKQNTTLIIASIVVIAVAVSASCKKEELTNPIIVVTEDNPITDFDGNTYKTIKIGDQIWMAENLKSTHYSDGSPIDFLNYNNDEANADIYGRLYTQSAALNGSMVSNTNPSDVQGISPVGWHLPSIAEWQQLIVYLGGVDFAGKRMKEGGTAHWQSPNTGTNEGLFNAQPAGIYDFSDSFGWKGNHCVFASTTAQTAVMLQNSTSKVVVGSSHPDDRISVRCIKD